jgi:hypothetical protein
MGNVIQKEHDPFSVRVGEEADTGFFSATTFAGSSNLSDRRLRSYSNAQ